ncbi:methionyl-tRNA formyltransferase [Prevotella sp. 10(H)]|uniref:methionyl-tRNA formyltransferase n=1 Tax=Prevotella sp. 10(H) TaxID=1158294 RepID=UPI0006894EC9|nr:formyltransferase family protein [Prevotella sp. 10(H)]
MVRINLLGYKGYYVLSNIHRYYDLIDDVVIGKDANVENDYYTEIVNLCSANNIKCYDRGKEPKIQSRYLVLIGWRWLIQEEATLIVFHDSLLPKYRGFNPLVSALINGDEYIGATCLLGEKEYDTGAIIGQLKVKVTYPIKIKDAISIISELYLDLIVCFLDMVNNDETIRSTPQIEADSTYSLWRNEDDYFIDWNQDAEKIKRFIDAVGPPYDGAKTKSGENTLTIFDARTMRDVTVENRVPGKVIFKDSDGLVIVCGKGLLQISHFYKEDNTIFDYSKLFRLKFV